MHDSIALIEKLNKDHEGIRGYVNIMLSELKDWQNNSVNLHQISGAELRRLNQKYLNIRQTAGYLEEGLQRHWEIEESQLPSLIGTPLIEALQIEHHEILKQLKEVNTILINSSLEDFSAKLIQLNALATHLCNLISDHEMKESIILQLLKKRFE